MDDVDYYHTPCHKGISINSPVIVNEYLTLDLAFRMIYDDTFRCINNLSNMCHSACILVVIFYTMEYIIKNILILLLLNG